MTPAVGAHGSDAPTLLDIYLALSHIGPASGPLAPLAGEAPEETPRLYIAHIATDAADEWRVFLRPDLPAAVRDALAALPPQALFTDVALAAGILTDGETDGARPDVWQGRTLLFPDDLSDLVAPLANRDDLVRLAPAQPGDDWYGASAPGDARRRPAIAPADEEPPAREAFPGEQFAALADGLVVATCQSSRESALAAEAWARTLPAARGRRHATRVTALWALDARRRGKIPFYSYHRANQASAGVARALSLIPFLEDVGYL
ncbi:MAG TPA: hypothetical protein VFX31_01285 [Ktedonobacterales bacterium]|jgi:hypothetical protein|nr:hypothetical protein [Ktedonobacterales bacterium]HEX5569988.1 hypothetical protein [Ktedonobacterales bacterium]